MLVRRRRRQRVPGGFFRFETADRSILFGSGDTDLIRLRDEFGNTWWGVAEDLGENLIRYRFRDDHGNTASGLSDHTGILLRDQRGKTWRGYLL
jgi:hypothetical protein